jgi:hypothetical protein
MAAEEGDQPVRGRDIGANGMLGPAPLARQMVVPALRDGGRFMVLSRSSERLDRIVHGSRFSFVAAFSESSGEAT